MSQHDHRRPPDGPVSSPWPPAIQMVGEDADGATAPASVVFVGGPADGERREVSDAPAAIQAGGGTYRRSVRCADDGALRFVFEPAPDEPLTPADGPGPA